MAGAKETPRQKLISLMYLVFITMLALNVSKEVLDGFGQMFEKIAIKNKATEYRDPLTNVWEDTQLSNVFFSQGNVQILQNGLRAGVHNRSGERELVIPPQNIDVLKTFMRDTFINYSTFEPTNITAQVARLNKLLLEQLIPVVYSEAIGYLKYLEDQSRLVVQIALPQQSDRVYKQLELKPFM